MPVVRRGYRLQLIVENAQVVFQEREAPEGAHRLMVAGARRVNRQPVGRGRRQLNLS